MRVFRDVLAAIAMLLVVVTVADSSMRALVAAVLFATAAYGVHRRFLVVWWLGLGLLLWSAVDSVIDLFCGPGTHVAIMCSLVSILLSALLLSVWLRQHSYFQRHATNKT